MNMNMICVKEMKKRQKKNKVQSNKRLDKCDLCAGMLRKPREINSLVLMVKQHVVYIMRIEIKKAAADIEICAEMMKNNE